jgi:hypothetical protein
MKRPPGRARGQGLIWNRFPFRDHQKGNEEMLKDRTRNGKVSPTLYNSKGIRNRNQEQAGTKATAAKRRRKFVMGFMCPQDWQRAMARPWPPNWRAVRCVDRCERGRACECGVGPWLIKDNEPQTLGFCLQSRADAEWAIERARREWMKRHPGTEK